MTEKQFLRLLRNLWDLSVEEEGSNLVLRCCSEDAVIKPAA